jgi:hypothetical protein
MADKKFTAQATRIKAFVEEMKITPTEFGRECGFKSPRTMQAICSDGNAPTTKALTKIVERFPHLNYDWVLLGIGEMINVGFEKNSSAASINKSTGSGFSQINKKLAVNDLAVNELGVDIARVIKTSETNMLVYTQSMANLTNKIEQFDLKMQGAIEAAQEVNKQVIENTDKMRDGAHKRTILFFENLDKKNELIFKHFDKEIKETRELNEKIETNNREYINSLDKKRSETNAASFDKLSRKTHAHLLESREMQERLIQGKIDEGIKKGIEHLTKEMHKNAVAQTDFAIKSLLDKFSLKKIIPKIGGHTKVKKD